MSAQGEPEPAEEDTLTPTRDLMSKLLQVPKDEVAGDQIRMTTNPRPTIRDFRSMDEVERAQAVHAEIDRLGGSEPRWHPVVLHPKPV